MYIDMRFSKSKITLEQISVGVSVRDGASSCADAERRVNRLDRHP